MSQPPAVIMKSSDQIIQETAELIEKLENEKTQQEEIAKKAKERNVFQMNDLTGFNGVGQQATEEETMESNDQLSGTNRSTIGNTFIPPEERARIRDEVRAVMHQNFPGIQFSTVHNSEPGKSGAHSVDMTNSGQNSAPMAIAGSEVSVASTANNRGNAVEFSRLSQ